MKKTPRANGAAFPRSPQPDCPLCGAGPEEACDEELHEGEGPACRKNPECILGDGHFDGCDTENK